MTRPGIEPWSPGPLANTQPLGQWAGKIPLSVLLYQDENKKNYNFLLL